MITTIDLGIDPWLMVAMLLSIITLKIISMWIASKRDNLWMFILLAVLHTGIVEAIYIIYAHIKSKKDNLLIK